MGSLKNKIVMGAQCQNTEPVWRFSFLPEEPGFTLADANAGQKPEEEQLQEPGFTPDANAGQKPEEDEEQISETPPAFTGLYAESMRQHITGKCHPCVAFSLRPGGCFKGNNCSHCHFCTADQALQRRRELQIEARHKKRDAKLEPHRRVKRFWL
ncbi:unnamed protein product [Effrenium voratum]|nr:unnamed protein product [Effrenium voratum]